MGDAWVAGDEVHFKVKPTTKFEKIFNAWKTRKAVQTGVRFMVDGVQLHAHRTPGEEHHV
jgi:small ubiquitin-related modifier